MMPTTSGCLNGKGILVLGGGMAGMSAALEAAEAGCSVVLVEKAPFLGGRVARMNQYFPKLCPPGCGLEINFKRLKNNGRVEVLTQSELLELTGSPGDYTAKIQISPRHVTDACTLCGECAKVCPAERADEFNYGLCKTKAAYIPYPMAYPALFAIDRAACSSGCDACARACAYGAVDLDQKAQTRTLNVAAVVAATGWAPYDATKIDNLGYGRCANVVTNVILERLASLNGPTGGRILRPSDGKEPKTVAFVQCAGSRDENHLPYCSAVCCAASLKQATYVRSAYPDAKVKIFYIDVRTPGRLEDFASKVSADPSVELVKGKVAKVEEDPATRDVLIEVEDVIHGRKLKERVDLLVLATGIVPQAQGLPGAAALDEFGFVENRPGKTGFYAAGCVHRPEEVSATVQEGTGAALKAFQCVVRSAHHG
jgi:quinone-modifying oxidoreductase, subunit QmoA